MQTKSASYPSAAWIQDFSTVISGGAVVVWRPHSNGNKETEKKVGDKYSFYIIFFVFFCGKLRS